MSDVDNQQQDSKRNSEKQPLKKLQRRRRAPKNQFRGDDDFNWGKVLKVVLSWSAIILGVFFVMLLFRTKEGTEYPIAYTEYQSLLKGGYIKEADIRKSENDNFDLHGTLKQTRPVTTLTGKSVSVDKFVVTLPYIDATVIKD